MNDQTQEALKMAIARLEKSNFELDSQGNYSTVIHNNEVIAICKEALGNLEKDYSFSRNLSDKDNKFADKIEVANCNLKQPAQEPVGYITNNGLSAVFKIGLDLDDGTPLYARRE
jgi:hypothetical protein